jgi:hypothetical protein
MRRQLPLIEIAGTAFYVDVVNDCLQQQDHTANRIPFEVFEQERDGYTFIYDTKFKNAAAVVDAADPADDRYAKITLPALMELDPEGIAIKYNIPLEVLCPEKASAKHDDDDDDDFFNEEIFE